MKAFRALKRRTGLMAGVVALTFAAPLAGFGTPAAGHSGPAVGGSIGDVITTTCGNSAVIVLSVIVCEA
jgi:hypothetical protein